MKYTFIAEEQQLPYSEYRSEKITIETKAVGLDSVIETFERFLRASGYHFTGRLDIVIDDGGQCCDHITDDDDRPYAMDLEMPGTIGGAKVVFREPTLSDGFNGIGATDLPKGDPLEKCKVKGCGLTRAQLGSCTCFDSNCGLK